jgi:hypothetical protein
MIEILPFISYSSHVRAGFAACAVERRAALNTNRGAVCVVGSAFSTVNHFIPPSRLNLVLKPAHIRLVVGNVSM